MTQDRIYRRRKQQNRIPAQACSNGATDRGRMALVPVYDGRSGGRRGGPDSCDPAKETS